MFFIKIFNEKLWARISHVVKCFLSITKAKLWVKFTPHFDCMEETLMSQSQRKRLRKGDDKLFYTASMIVPFASIVDKFIFDCITKTVCWCERKTTEWTYLGKFTQNCNNRNLNRVSRTVRETFHLVFLPFSRECINYFVGSWMCEWEMFENTLRILFIRNCVLFFGRRKKTF